jgi:hypothetical protein
MCIAQMGSVPCPQSAYTQQLAAFGGVNDQRGCTACSCGSLMGAGPCGTVYLNPAAANCFGPFLVNAAVPTPCTSIAADTGYYGSYSPSTGIDGGTCPPLGGQPTGTATPANPVTICCAS